MGDLPHQAPGGHPRDDSRRSFGYNKFTACVCGAGARAGSRTFRRPPPDKVRSGQPMGVTWMAQDRSDGRAHA